MRIIIIGGVAAGAKAAAKTKRELPDSEVHIYTKDNFVSYSSCGMPYYIAGDFQDWQKLIVRSVEEFENYPVIVEQAMIPVSIPRFSEAKQQKMILKGIKGKAVLTNLTEEQLELLLAGELVHVGKNTSFGFGRYTVKDNNI